MDEDEAFYHWYGPWTPLTPPELAEILDGLAAPWWLVGGWAIETHTGRPREHEDIDVGFWHDDLPAVLDHLLPDFCVWSNNGGTLRPLRTPGELLDGCRQLWLRRDGGSPWLADMLLTRREGDTWIAPRNDWIRFSASDIALESPDGVRYLRPEIVLSLKGRLGRPKDEDDLAAVLPTLDPAARSWFRSTLERLHPGHPWLDRLDLF